MHRYLPFALLLVLLPVSADVGRADEEAQPVPLATRVFEIGALTAGYSNHFRPMTPLEARPRDEAHPLFGGQAEEPYYPAGQVDEICELIKTQVDPRLWETTEGVDVVAMGESHLLVRAPRVTLDAIASHLAGLEREVLSPITTELKVVSFTRSKNGKAPTAASLATSPILAFGSVTQVPGQKSVVWGGLQHAYVHRYDVEVAKGSDISVPRAQVANLGLSATIAARPGNAGDQIRLSVDASLATLESNKLVSVGEGREIESLRVRTFNTRVDALVATGEWTVMDTATTAQGADVAYVARAHRRQLAVRPTNPAHQILSMPAFDDSGQPAVQRYNIGQLVAPVQHVYAVANWILTPSRYTPLERPELPDPRPAISRAAMPDLLQTVIGTEGTWEDPAAIWARGEYLHVRNTPLAHKATAALLKRLRTGLLRTTTLRAEIVEVDSAVADRLIVQGHFSAAERERLLPEQSTTLTFAGQVHSTSDARRVLTNGASIDYVGSYEVEIAENTSIGKPIMARTFEGVSLELWPHLSVTEGYVNVEVMLAHTDRIDENRSAATPLGRIETPQLRTTRVSSTIFAQLGKTTVVSAVGTGKRRQVLLLTPTLSRPK